MRLFCAIFVTASVFFVASWLGTAAQAERDGYDAEHLEAMEVRVRLCDYWVYNRDSRSYTCDWLGGQVSLVESRDILPLQQAVQELRFKVNELEQRLRDLERRD